MPNLNARSKHAMNTTHMKKDTMAGLPMEAVEMEARDFVLDVDRVQPKPAKTEKENKEDDRDPRICTCGKSVYDPNTGTKLNN